MYSLVFLATLSFALSLILTPIVRNGFKRLAILDHPVGGRRIHTQPVPRVGGIAIILAYVLAFIALLISPLRGADLITNQLHFISKVMPAAVLIFAVGFVDDIVGIRWWHKLGGQLAAASLACWAGIRFDNIIGHPLGAAAGIPLTLIWLVACTNAFNLIDGMDGLATGAGLLAALTILTGGLLQNNTPLLFAIVPLIGALFGFLRYNFHPASIFLGDSGSLTLGFLLGCYGLIWSQKSATLLGMTAPLIAFSLPLVETSLTIARRFLRNQPIFSPDRRHIHHQLLEKGMTPKRAVLLLYIVCGIAAILSLLQSVAKNSYGGVLMVLFCAVAWIGIQRLNYAELEVAGRMFSQGTFQNVIDGQVHLQEFEKSLVCASDLDSCWKLIQQAGLQFGFESIELRTHERKFISECGSRVDAARAWSIQLPVHGGVITLTRTTVASTNPMLIAPFLDVLQHSLSRRLEEFSIAATGMEPTDHEPTAASAVRTSKTATPLP